MKNFILIALLLPMMAACKKKNKSPKKYFSFDANGVHYDYPQGETPGGLFGGPSSSLGAGSMGFGLGYQIYGFSLKNSTAPGRITFNFAEDHIPDRDTIIFNGINNKILIEKFLNIDNNYELKLPLQGRIIFTERSNNLLSGIFEFDVYKMKVVDWHWEATDTILHITNGKFSIIPANQ
ncbi:MAG TPA: hypothetical protein PKX92_00215 [Edaphocola sp.]|nr:hypothetical protein [Edaphocola sp.]